MSHEKLFVLNVLSLSGFKYETKNGPYFI